MSKLNIHRKVHFAHGYRKVGGREVEEKNNFSNIKFLISDHFKIYQHIYESFFCDLSELDMQWQD